MKRLLIGVFLTYTALNALNLNQTPPHLILEGKDGGKISGGAWDSNTLTGKVHVLFYVDPDEKDKNERFADALKKANFDHSKYSSIAIVNLAATWKPDIVIEALLKSKQKKFPNATYVKDKNKVLVKKWGLKDDESDILIFDKDGKLIFIKEGRLSDSDIEDAIKLIKLKI